MMLSERSHASTCCPLPCMWHSEPGKTVGAGDRINGIEPGREPEETLWLLWWLNKRKLIELYAEGASLL